MTSLLTVDSSPFDGLPDVDYPRGRPHEFIAEALACRPQSSGLAAALWSRYTPATSRLALRHDAGRRDS